jgi:hypothetical protein
MLLDVRSLIRLLGRRKPLDTHRLALTAQRVTHHAHAA